MAMHVSYKSALLFAVVPATNQQSPYHGMMITCQEGLPCPPPFIPTLFQSKILHRADSLSFKMCCLLPTTTPPFHPHSGTAAPLATAYDQLTCDAVTCENMHQVPIFKEAMRAKVKLGFSEIAVKKCCHKDDLTFNQKLQMKKAASPQTVNHFHCNGHGSCQGAGATGGTFNYKEAAKKCEGSGNGVKDVGAAQIVCCSGQKVQCCASGVTNLYTGKTDVGCKAVHDHRLWQTSQKLNVLPNMITVAGAAAFGMLSLVSGAVLALRRSSRAADEGAADRDEGAADAVE